MKEELNTENIQNLTNMLGNKFFWLSRDLITETLYDAVSEILINQEKYEKYEANRLNRIILKITKNKLLKIIRRKNISLKYEPKLLELFPRTGIEEETESLKDEYYRLMTQNTDIFSTSELEILEWHYFTGLRFKEIAALKNKSTDAIKMQHARLIKKIRKIYPPPMQ